MMAYIAPFPIVNFFICSILVTIFAFAIGFYIFGMYYDWRNRR